MRRTSVRPSVRHRRQTYSTRTHWGSCRWRFPIGFLCSSLSSIDGTGIGPSDGSAGPDTVLVPGALWVSVVGGKGARTPPATLADMINT